MKGFLFISSVQKEFTQERRAVRDFVRNDPLLRRYFDVFLFENLPAADRAAEDDLMARGILQKVGTTGRGTYYVLSKKGDIKGT